MIYILFSFFINILNIYYFLNTLNSNLSTYLRKVSNSDKLLTKKRKLKSQYSELIEYAYNLRQMDEAMSDVAEFRATLILNKINKLKFVVEDNMAMA